MFISQRFCALSICTALVCLTLGSPARSKEVFSLTLAAPGEPHKAGAELRLRVTITNTSDRPLTFVTAPGPEPVDDYLYRITVHDERGRSAPASNYLRTRDKNVPVDYGSRIGRTLKPGESFTDEVTVTRFFDLSRPSRYTITVAREMPPRQGFGNGNIESNPITIVVTP